MIVSVYAESFCKTSCKGSFASTHFTHKHDEIAGSNKPGYRTGNCMRITKI
jgi:hypothetical protein